MKKYGLLGEHLSHSYSKIIHNLVFEELRIAASYELIECSKDELPCFIKALKEEKYAGFNVTIPYKKAIMPYLDEIDSKARQIGSVNTVYLKDGKAVGTNTDYDGFLETIRKYQIEVSNKMCYILGTGGASLAIYQVLKDLGGQCLFVSRTPKEKNQISYQELEESDIDILVNTTPVGMFPNVLESPVSITIAKKAKTVIDIIFNPKATKLLRDAGSEIHGLYMLIMQALKAEEIWQGKALGLSMDDFIERVELLIELPEEIYERVKNIPFHKDKVGRSEDRIYLFADRYVLKTSKDCERLKREREKLDWVSNYSVGSKSVAYAEHNSTGYYLRTYIQGYSLCEKRFLDEPKLLIKILKEAVQKLRNLDDKNCPFLSTDSCGSFFVHGDLCLPNICVDEHNNFCGFIDLENAGLGDIWYDYAWLLWSFEYNLGTYKYNELLLAELDIQMDKVKYHKYIPDECIKQLKDR